ncbi:putative Brefeldin A resistance protein [Aureobasidium subglaciale]|nr:putative Brefeldin A resistance protein [Aureobasidium subglaciale]
MSHGNLKPSASTPTLVPTPPPSQSGDNTREHHDKMAKHNGWHDMPEVRAIRHADGSRPVHRKLGVTWTNLTVKGVGADACFNENVLSQFLPGRLKGRRKTDKASLRTIIDNSHGCVKPGEMLLVLGRPGAGCTTLLKLLANRRSGFAEIDGEVNYGSLRHDEAKKYQGQIVMNTEDEIFFPSLTVGQTIDFATRMKVPNHVTSGSSSKEEAREASRDFILKQLSISHTKGTKVGNEFIRGVSGGERKRVSIIETMATRGSVYCWDNSTRGLDASTALQYIKAVRAMTDIFGLASIVTLYQAGNGIFEQFDKALVLDEGKQLYYGPAKMARPFMEDIGFFCPDGANVADYLTGVTVPTERQIREGYEARFPRTADQIVTLYESSDIRTQMGSEYDYPTTGEAKDYTTEFERTIAEEKTSDFLTKRAPTTVGFGAQLKAATQRQYQIIRGDINVLFIKQASNIVQALTSGSLFYNAPNTSTGLFIKSGALFVSLLFNVLLTQSEPTSGLDGQAAFNTVRFLKKLAAAGQAVLVTIHQPSSQLFAQFDNLLLLAKGGNTAYFGEIGENASVIRDYFGQHGAPCPEGKNPAEHMIDVISDTSTNWNDIWLSSPEHDAMLTELDRLQDPSNSTPREDSNESLEFAMPLWDQIKIVSARANTTMYRNIDYVNNKFAFHIITGLFFGFTFWQIGNSVTDLQQRLFACFNAIFVAPGVIAQLQPLFIQKRDIYDAREKKSKMYSWFAFVTSLIVSEFPYLVICAVQFFLCFYYTVGFPNAASSAGAFFFVMLMYEFIYTGIGQFIAAYASNAVAASLVNPLIIFTLVGFCGAVVPYGQITEFWRYWYVLIPSFFVPGSEVTDAKSCRLYYLNPFNYLIGAFLVFTTWDVQVTCKRSELAIFDPPSAQTCLEYLTPYMQGMGARTNLLNPSATSACEVCQYRTGADYLATLNLTEKYFGWRDAGIVVLFVFSGYGLVYLLMKLRTKKSKTAE